MKRRHLAVFPCLLAALAVVSLLSSCGPQPGNNANNTNKAAVASPSPDPCASTSDKQIWQAIYTEIAKDTKLAPQIQHLNILSKQRVVSFTGWADTKAEKDAIVNIAKGTACVLSVVPDGLADAKPSGNSPEVPKPGGCATGYKPCREFCIPEADACTTASDPMDPGGNVNSNTSPKTNPAGNANDNRKK